MEAARQDMNRIVDEYADMVRRICYSYLKNYHDTEDVFQNVFLKYLRCQKEFESKDHEKAWFIRVTINCCKDSLKSFFRKNTCSLEELGNPAASESEDLSYVREAVLTLPEKYRTVIYLFYYEQYSAIEISYLLHKKENTIYTWLKRGRELLKQKLGGDFFE